MKDNAVQANIGLPEWFSERFLLCEIDAGDAVIVMTL
jgi:hypothetical protein